MCTRCFFLSVLLSWLVSMYQAIAIVSWFIAIDSVVLFTTAVQVNTIALRHEDPCINFLQSRCVGNSCPARFSFGLSTPSEQLDAKFFLVPKKKLLLILILISCYLFIKFSVLYPSHVYGTKICKVNRLSYAFGSV